MPTTNSDNKSVFARYIDDLEKEPPPESEQTRQEQLEARLDTLATDLHRFRRSTTG